MTSPVVTTIDSWPLAQTAPMWPLLVYFGGALATAVGMIVLSYFLGQRHQDRATGEPYESGVVPTGSARTPFDIPFYLVALLFVIFDLEAVYLFAWAVSARELGWAGYAGALFFVGVLVAGLIYEWGVGALNWGPRPRRRRRIPPDRSRPAQAGNPCEPQPPETAAAGTMAETPPR